jgi:hypothetical protein
VELFMAMDEPALIAEWHARIAVIVAQGDTVILHCR